MLEELRNRSIFFKATILGSLFTAAGSLLGWFTADNVLKNIPEASSLSELANKLVLSELNDKEDAVLITAIVIFLATIFVGLKKQKMLGLIGAVLGLLAMIVVFNQLPDAEITEVFGITTNIGYWLAVIGVTGMFVGSVGIITGGVNKSATPARSESAPIQTAAKTKTAKPKKKKTTTKATKTK